MFVPSVTVGSMHARNPMRNPMRIRLRETVLVSDSHRGSYNHRGSDVSWVHPALSDKATVATIEMTKLPPPGVSISLRETNLTIQGNRLSIITKKVTSWAAIVAVSTAITGSTARTCVSRVRSPIGLRHVIDPYHGPIWCPLPHH